MSLVMGDKTGELRGISQNYKWWVRKISKQVTSPPQKRQGTIPPQIWRNKHPFHSPPERMPLAVLCLVPQYGMRQGAVERQRYQPGHSKNPE